ncbi:MAG: pyruvate-formate lyase [Spirochaetaceae bacterium]|nr:MAG: pyruvate-formate lyase [Spirochaetaceae bacterium]
MAQTTLYDARIDALRSTKIEHTEQKLARHGHFDVDDHGYIPWSDPIAFTPVSSHPSGGCWGMKDIGASFRRWLEVHPVYIHPQSAIAGAWVYKGIPGVAGFDVTREMGAPDTSSGGRKRVMSDYPKNWRPEDRPTHLYEQLVEYNTYSAGIGHANHIGPDMTIGLDLGWGGLLDKVRRHRERNRPTDTTFYDGEENLILGVQVWINRHVEHATAMARLEDDPATRENLQAIAAINAHLVDGAPRTFREAVQFMGWFQCIDRMWSLGGALGQLDELLRPYYEADRSAGRETDESVVWQLCSLFFNDSHYSQIGGQGSDGRDLTSRMSFLVLDAMHRISIPVNVALRVHDRMDRSLLIKALEHMAADGTGVDFALSGGLDAGFARNGYPIGLARMRAKVGCNWTALPGIEYGSQDGTRLCLVTPLLLAIDDALADEGAAADLPATMDALWRRYAHHLAVAVATVKAGKDIHMERQADNYPEIVLNLFCHGPIERGLDASAGGLDIIDLAFDAIGLATTADSFAAIEQRVATERRLSLAELRRHLDDDFAAAEQVRLMLATVPRYGSGGTRADDWAVRIASLWTSLVRDTPTERGRWVCMPGLFSHGATAVFGRTLGATPNGRRAGEPVSHSADPDPGFVPGGGVALTAKANAVASTQSGWGNTTPLQVEVDTGLMNSLGGIESVADFIFAHNRQGGTLINMNIVKKEHVLEAHEDPATHPDLMIRVTGYSAYFGSLSREYRQPIVDRIIAGG